MALTQACINEMKQNPKNYRAIFDKHNAMQSGWDKFDGADLVTAERLTGNWIPLGDSYEEKWRKIYETDKLIMR